MPSAIGLAGMGAVPGLIGWHAVNVTDGSGGAALAAAISGASANALAADSLQRTVLDRLSHHTPHHTPQHALPNAAPNALPNAATHSSSETPVDLSTDLHRRHAQRLGDGAVESDTPLPEATAGISEAVDAAQQGGLARGDAFAWRSADRVNAQSPQALRRRVTSALDALQDRFQASRLLMSPTRTAPLAVGYFQQDQDLTPDAALAVSLTAAASRAPRSDALADALAHMLSLSTSTTPARLSALREADDGGESDLFDPDLAADASAVTYRTLQRALHLLAEQQRQLPAERHAPLHDVSAAFAPERIAPFGASVRIGIARHWSGTIAIVQTASSYGSVFAPSEEADPFLRNMLHKLSREAGTAAVPIDADPARRAASLMRLLDPDFVAEVGGASMVFRGGPPQPQPQPPPSAAGALAADGSLLASAAAPITDSRTAAAPVAVDALFTRLFALCGDDAAIVQALSRRLHQSSLLAAASPVLAQYAVDADPQRLLLPADDGSGQWLVLGESPVFHVDVWADPGGGVCADTEVKWPIRQYGATPEGEASTPGRLANATVPAAAMQIPTAPSWLQIRRLVHVGREETSDGREGVLALTYGVSHLCAEIAHRMGFDTDSGQLI